MYVKKGDLVCQSCGLPMPRPADHGTHSDGSPSNHYCKHCYQNGDYTIQANTCEQFVDLMLAKMKEDPEAPKMNRDQCLTMLKGLARWKTE